MKIIGILALVVLLLLVGLPLATGLSMDMDAKGHCPACAPDAPLALVMCVAILSLFALLVPLSRRYVWLTATFASARDSFASLFRPPRTA